MLSGSVTKMQRRKLEVSHSHVYSRGKTFAARMFHGVFYSHVQGGRTNCTTLKSGWPELYLGSKNVNSPIDDTYHSYRVPHGKPNCPGANERLHNGIVICICTISTRAPQRQCLCFDVKDENHLCKTCSDDTTNKCSNPKILERMGPRRTENVAHLCRPEGMRKGQGQQLNTSTESVRMLPPTYPVCSVPNRVTRLHIAIAEAVVSVSSGKKAAHYRQLFKMCFGKTPDDVLHPDVPDEEDVRDEDD